MGLELAGVVLNSALAGGCADWSKPLHGAVSDLGAGAATLGAVPERGRQADRVVVLGERPLGRPERRNEFGPASAEVRGDLVLAADVNGAACTSRVP
jgi:hypothetical protein